MSRRALGCGTLAAVAFVGLGLFGIWRATAPAGCPDLLPYEPASYEPVGNRSDEPRLDGVEVALERSGNVAFGLASWEVWVEPGRAPSASGEPLPQRIVLDCGNDTFQAYQRGTG